MSKTHSDKSVYPLTELLGGPLDGMRVSLEGCAAGPVTASNKVTFPRRSARGLAFDVYTITERDENGWPLRARWL